MHSFALFSLVLLAFAIFASAVPAPGASGSDDALAGRNPPGEYSDGGSDCGSLIDVTVIADIGFVRPQDLSAILDPLLGTPITITYVVSIINNYLARALSDLVSIPNDPVGTLIVLANSINGLASILNGLLTFIDVVKALAGFFGTFGDFTILVEKTFGTPRDALIKAFSDGLRDIINALDSSPNDVVSIINNAILTINSIAALGS